MELSFLENYQQSPNKIMKNQGEKNPTETLPTLESCEFIHYIATLIGPSKKRI